MSKNFFSVVAECVAKRSMTEAYVIVGVDAMTALGDGHLTTLLCNLGDNNLRAKDRIVRDYHDLRDTREAMFTDKAKGFVSVDGVLVSFSVARIADDHLRVHFIRVDAGALYKSTQERLSNLEKNVSALLKVAKLDSGE